MSEETRADLEWAEWRQVLRRLVGEMQAGQLARALQEVREFLESVTVAEVRSDALGFSAQLKEELHDLKSAKLDLLAAQSLVVAGYARYVHELRLGKLCSDQGNVGEAVSWFAAALKTCIAAEDVSAGKALAYFVRLRGDGRLSAEERALCENAARQSWHVLRLAGKPDVTNLNEVAATLRKGEAGRDVGRADREHEE